MAIDPEKIKKRFESLKGSIERTNCESHWEELAAHILPNAVGFVGQQTAGAKRMSKVFDPTGIHANELLAAGLHGLITNPSSKWFSLRMTDDDLNELPSVKVYLSDVEKRMWSAMYAPGTNLTTSLHEAYLALGALGTAIIFVGQRDDGGFLFQSRTLAECVIAENADGIVDTLKRCFKYKVRQVMQMSKLPDNPWKPSEKVQKLHDEGKFDEDIEIIHSVCPRTDRQHGKSDPENMPFVSCYVEKDTGHLLEEGGFPEFPFLVPRWSKLPGEIYGRSPGMTALPDIKMLQAQSLTYIKALQKNADPPMWLPDDGVVGPTRTMPGGINYYRGTREIIMHPTSIQGLQAVNEGMTQVRDRIRNMFFVDVLQMVDQREMTLGEARMRQTERMRLMGPMAGRNASELLGPMITRVFGMMYRQGLLPDAPEEIQDRDFTVEYVSPIATAQKQTELNGIWQALEPFLMMKELGAQVVMENVALDRVLEHSWDVLNNDPKLLKSDEEKGAQDQKKQAAEATQLALPLADVAQKGAGAVKQIADAQAGGGLDLAGLLKGTMDQVQANPRLQRQIAQASDDAQGQLLQ
jgi:hypothetical protein